MSHPRRIAGVAPVVAALTLVCSSALGQVSPITCIANSGVPPIVRAEGRTELAGDLILECTGLKQALTTTLTLTFNTNVTSRVLGAKSEALLFLNEPKLPRVSGPGAPLSPGSNLFQGIVSGNVVTFANVTLQPPQDSNYLAVRFTNIRVDASQLGESATLIPTQVMVSVAASSPAISISNPNQTVGYILSGLVPSIIGTGPSGSGRIGLPVCAANNAPLLSNPSATGSTADMILRFRERFQTAFKRQLEPDQEHSLPGSVWNSESGFVDVSLPATDRLNEAGTAKSGTRLAARFRNVPAGLGLYVSTVPVDRRTSVSAKLIRTDATGGGPAASVPATTVVLRNGVAVPIARVPVIDGTGLAVWEVDGANPSEQENFDFVLVAAYNGGTIQPATVSIDMSLAPYSDDASWIPRFIAPATSTPLVLYACEAGLPDLKPVIRTPVAVAGGSTVQYAATVYNNSPSPVSAFEYTIEVLSPGRTTVVYSATRRVASALPAWSAIELVHLLPVDASLPVGNYDVRLTLDPANRLGESDEQNNHAWGILQVWCGTQATPPSLLVSPAGGIYPVPVTSSCVINPLSSVPWAAVADGHVTVAPNTTNATRTGMITVEWPWARVPIIQPAAMPGCTYAISGPTVEAAPQGQGVTLNITTSQSTCTWTLASSAGWLQVYPLTGTGSAQVQATVFPNFALENRTATVAVGSATLDIRQSPSTGSLNRRIVQQTYFNFFGRMPSEPEIAFQQAELDKGVPPAGLIERFYATPEFNNGGRFIAGLYVGLLARDAEYGGWLFQRNALSANQVTQNSIVSNFVSSAEWRMKYGLPSDAEYVQILYRNILLREAGPAEIDFHTRTLTTKAVDRIQMATNFLNSSEFRNGTGPRLTAFLLYATLAARDPLDFEFNNTVSSVERGTPVRQLLDQMTSRSDYLRLLQ